MQEEEKSILVNEADSGEISFGGESNFDYDFLKNPENQRSSDEMVTNQFDTAFNQSSPVIQDYILSKEFEENIKLICKIEKLDDPKANTIVENVAVSILIGLIPISEAKSTMIESFRSSGLLLESFAASLILKNIDTYILSEIRKQILQSKISDNKEIRHLTLKEKNYETQKEELRKILLEKTGNLTGKRKTLIAYQQREIPKQKPVEVEETQKKYVANRESLLAKINLNNVSDTQKIKERMSQIKKEEEQRISRAAATTNREKLAERERAEATEEAREELLKDEKELEKIKEAEEEKENISKIFAEELRTKLAGDEDEKADLNALRKQREKEEVELQKYTETAYSRSLQEEGVDNKSRSEEALAFDPYRESF